MSQADIDKGVREGWLVPEADGWYRFVWDFEPIPGGGWRKIPARGIKRVRVLLPR